MDVELRDLDAPSEVAAGSGFSVSVTAVNKGAIPPQGGNHSCEADDLNAAAEQIDVDLSITNGAGQTVESASTTVCAPYGNYLPGIDSPRATFEGLSVPGGGSYTVTVDAEFSIEVVGSDRVTRTLSVSGTPPGDDGGSDPGGEAEPEDEDGSVVGDISDELPDVGNTQLAAAGVVGAIVLYVLY